jgi:phosphoribosylformylglycinamidine cyclo-ligase
MTDRDSSPMTYRQAGVDIDAGDELVRRIKPMARRTFGPRVVDNFGAFAGLFRLDYNEKLFKKNYQEPVLVACTDGVGTKLRVAIDAQRFETIGIDLVAMSVNDMICCGAEPLLFLDYLAVGKLDPDKMATVVEGIAQACKSCGAALLGGETAEMPGMYRADDFDLAGFAVGVVERGRIVDTSHVEPGDVVIGLASDGLHSNGFGLARKVLLERGGLSLTDTPPELEGATVAEELLRPTRLYVRPVLDLYERYRVKRVVKAMAHITGGGLPGNLPRSIPDGLTVRIKKDSWPVPPVFRLIASTGPVDPIEMHRVFNMGIGFVLVVAASFAKPVMNHLRRQGERCYEIGKVRKGGPDLVWN